MKDIAIRVQNVTKDFHVYEKPLDLALEILTRKKRHRAFRALDDVSFAVERGQVLGIIGANGAGKSTLLKIITGVLDASDGTVDVRGRVTAILELGLGFNPEHSGRDNIYLSGMLYGMSREEIDQKLESIIHFSGLRAFMEQPVKTYSSGMYARLAFSIATAVDPDILIIDEALAAGDAMFVQKSMRRIRQLCAGGRTVLLVSHGTGILAQLCREVVWLEVTVDRQLPVRPRQDGVVDLRRREARLEAPLLELRCQAAQHVVEVDGLGIHPQGRGPHVDQAVALRDGDLGEAEARGVQRAEIVPAAYLPQAAVKVVGPAVVLADEGARGAAAVRDRRPPVPADIEERA